MNNKFRGKTQEGEWIHGYLLDDVIVTGISEIEEDYIAFEEWCSIIKETAGQFTGLKDKNEKEIYEGDVFLDRVNECYGIVIFKDGCFGIQWYVVDGYLSESGWDENGEFGELDFEPLNSINVDNMEIAGNIYENPELIKQQ